MNNQQSLKNLYAYLTNNGDSNISIDELDVKNDKLVLANHNTNQVYAGTLTGYLYGNR